LGVTGVVAQGFCDVGRADVSERADGEVSQPGHDAWRVAGADLAVVFTEGDIADVVQPVVG